MTFTLPPDPPNTSGNRLSLVKLLAWVKAALLSLAAYVDSRTAEPAPEPIPEPIPEPTPTPTPTPGTVAVVRKADFEDGSLGGFGTWQVATPKAPLPKIRVITDPTGVMGGKVGELRYQSDVGADDNTCLVQPGANSAPGNEAALPIGMIKTRRYEMDWYVTPSWRARSVADGAFQGKLLYIKHSEFYGHYPTSRLVVGTMGTEFYVNYTMNDLNGNSDTFRKYGYFPLNIDVGKHSLKVEFKRESSVGAADGIVRVWVDGNMIWDRSDVQLSLSEWIGKTMDGHTWAAADLYMDTVLIGQQCNVVQGTAVRQDYDELRYIDNVIISDF